MKKQMNVLAMGAHPDDIELLCGGTLALYSKLGNKIYMYHASNGDKGGFDKSNKEIEETRSKEAINSAKVINAVSIGGDFRDGEVIANLENRLLIIDVIRKCDPDIIFTHYPNDYHTDHNNLSKLVFEASYMASIPNLKTKYRAMKKIPRVYYIDTVCGIGFEPKEYVDVSDVIDLKLQMMRQHKSQLEFVKKLSNVDFIDMLEVSARYRGYQCNVNYAEGFIESIVWPKGSTERVLP